MWPIYLFIVFIILFVAWLLFLSFSKPQTESRSTAPGNRNNTPQNGMARSAPASQRPNSRSQAEQDDTGLLNPLNPLGLTNPLSTLNPIGFTHPLSPLNPVNTSVNDTCDTGNTTARDTGSGGSYTEPTVSSDACTSNSYTPVD